MHIPFKQILPYGLCALPLAFASLPIYVHAPEFYAVEFSLSLGTLGLLLLLIRALDAVQDPLLGWVIDRHPAARASLTLAAMLLFALSFAALFNPIQHHTLLWFAGSLFGVTLAYSTLSIMLNTQGGIWSAKASDHTRITTTREAFGLLGLLTAAALPTVLQQELSMVESFTMLSAIFTVILILCGGAYLYWQRAILPATRAKKRTETSVKATLRQWGHLIAREKAFYGTYLLSVFASSIPAVLVLFFIRDRLGAEDQAGLFLLLYFLAGALGMPLWHQLAKRLGQAQSWAISMALAIATFVWAYFLGIGDTAQYMVICVASGIAFGAELALPPAMIAGRVAAQKHNDQAGSYYALMAFCLKLSIALAAGLTLPLLDLAGYVPAQENSDQALHALSLSYALVPCALKIGALFLLIHTNLGGIHAIITQKGSTTHGTA